ncbi:hypothetical protein [Pseudonocardia acaciae]|uniref:hypothetical protein n=1 Tax=Pseudonocardia acaciae TaxID=551276 RepID=UPI00049221B3|nr:hypothetical protein [Pseudonocardia acaciae]
MSTTTTAPARRRWTGWRWIGALTNRWPTALAVGLTALTWGGGGSDAEVGGLGETLLLLPLLYLVVATTRRPRLTWPVAVAGIALVTVLRMLDVVAPSTVLVLLALLGLLWGVVDGHGHGHGMVRVQAVGMIVFGALALVGLAVDPALGRYLVAGGWFAHGVWDFVHLRLNRVVARSFAEWCGVVDVLIAVQLVMG